MEETYKKHLIRSHAEQVRKGAEWKPIVQINWSEGTRERVKLWMDWHFKCSFPTANEAEMEGHLFAKRWIDDVKPSLEYER